MRNRRIRSGLSLLVVSAMTLAACGGTPSGTTAGDPPEPTPTVVEPAAALTSTEWVKSVDWDDKEVIEIEMVETENGLTFSLDDITLEAGKPYVMQISNSASNAGKHYFAPGEGEDFFQAIATRKVQTADAEYKAPYFSAVELLIGGTLEIYFVPVLPGTYEFVCTIEGHEEAGMHGLITITGGEGNHLDLEVADDWDSTLASDPRKSGSDTVWENAVETTVNFVEDDPGSEPYGFSPEDLELAEGVGYKLTLANSGENVSKHYFTAAEFYKTVVIRKAEDSQAEIKVPYFTAVELLIGGEATLFIVPTSAGSFEVICTIDDHVALGMYGQIKVTN